MNGAFRRRLRALRFPGHVGSISWGAAALTGLVACSALAAPGPFFAESGTSGIVSAPHDAGSRAFAFSVQPGQNPAWAQMAGDGAPTGRSIQSRNLKSLGLSLLLPGLAQLEMGHKLRASVFFTAEGAFWTAFAAYRIQGAQREDSYVQMAEVFAGVDHANGRDDDYYRNLAGWPSSELYNEYVVRRDARTRYGDDLEAREAYYEDNRISGEDAWSWTSDSARERYADKRSDAKRSYKHSRNMIGLAVANRLVSMIDAVLLERRDSKLRVELAPEPGAQGARLALRRELP
ncbi:MAG: hypothetical protein KC729_11455 [Candidatus Eisenbacteria bacterium]|uniref:DUF5683 domain-containing protein n=1 Tax=Eiseniibacteriota bacterium TaxID=2212470 RepID=A0A956RQD4_UNCEI|nr:hypothetical protein [Candidatus Eisenbacteria bacterium]